MSADLRIWWAAVRDARREGGTFWALVVLILAPVVLLLFKDLENAVDC